MDKNCHVTILIEPSWVYQQNLPLKIEEIAFQRIYISKFSWEAYPWIPLGLSRLRQDFHSKSRGWKNLLGWLARILHTCTWGCCIRHTSYCLSKLMGITCNSLPYLPGSCWHHQWRCVGEWHTLHKTHKIHITKFLYVSPTIMNKLAMPYWSQILYMQ